MSREFDYPEEEDGSEWVVVETLEGAKQVEKIDFNESKHWKYLQYWRPTFYYTDGTKEETEENDGGFHCLKCQDFIGATLNSVKEHLLSKHGEAELKAYVEDMAVTKARKRSEELKPRKQETIREIAKVSSEQALLGALAQIQEGPWQPHTLNGLKPYIEEQLLFLNGKTDYCPECGFCVVSALPSNKTLDEKDKKQAAQQHYLEEHTEILLHILGYKEEEVNGSLKNENLTGIATEKEAKDAAEKPLDKMSDFDKRLLISVWLASDTQGKTIRAKSEQEKLGAEKKWDTIIKWMDKEMHKRQTESR